MTWFVADERDDAIGDRPRRSNRDERGYGSRRFHVAGVLAGAGAGAATGFAIAVSAAVCVATTELTPLSFEAAPLSRSRTACVTVGDAAS